jgi:beta-lactamase regulating signal transducer with metallopeptidase domain
MSGYTVGLLNGWGLAWADAMRQSLIEATSVLAIVGLAWLLLRARISSALASGLFLLVLIKAAVPLVLPMTPSVVLPWPVAQPLRDDREAFRPDSIVGAVGTVAPVELANAPLVRSTVTSRGIAATEQDPRGPERFMPGVGTGLSAQAAVMLAWASVVVILFARFVAIHVRMTRRLRVAPLINAAAVPVDPVALARVAGLKCPVNIFETPWASAPAVWGLFRPCVLVPPGLIESLSKEQLTWALLHELAHVRRGDCAVLLLQRLTQIVFFFHPAVWLANRAADIFREFACDDASLALTGIARQDCGAGFLAIAERACLMQQRPSLTPLGLFGSYILIRKRLERILNDHRVVSPQLSWGATVLLVMASLATLPHVRAQTPGDRAPVKAAEPAGAVANILPLTLTVIDRRNGDPLADAQLEMTIRGIAQKGSTDKSGRFAIPRPKGERMWVVVVTVRKDGYVPTRVSWNYRNGIPITPPTNYRISLEPGTRIGGLVKDSDGRPIAGATVYVLVPQPASKRPEPEPIPYIWDHPSLTDENGHWHCDIIPAELSDVWIRLAHPDHVSDTGYGSTPKPTVRQLRDGTGVMIMKKGLPVSGVVRDARGQPLAGAVVAQGANRPGRTYAESTTDHEGHFVFAHVAPGELVLTVQAKGHAPDLRSLVVAPDLAPIEFRLGPPRSIRGNVVDGDGKPLNDVWVTADSWRGHRSLSMRTETGTDGRFLMNDLPDEPVEFQFYKEGFMSLPNQRLVPSDKDVQITLTPPLQISGSVTDADTREPILHFSVYEGMNPSAQLTAQDRTRPRPFGNGAYAVNFRWPYPQVRYLHVEAPGYLPAISRGFRFNEKAQLYDFKLTRGTVPTRPAIEGVVRLPDGSPAAGAEVALAMKTAAPSIQDGRIAEPKRHPTAIAGTGGTFRFEAQTEPAIVMVFHERGYAEATEAQLAELPAHALTLQSWGRVEGTIRVGARPGARESVTLNPKRTIAPDDMHIYFGYEVNADTQGRFTFERVRPGSATVSRTIRRTPNSFAFGPWVPVEVRPSETAHVSIGGTGRPVIGRVVRRAGENITIDWALSRSMFRLRPPPIDEPANMTQEQRTAWYNKWSSTAEGKAYLAYQNGEGFYAFGIERDGSFRIDDVRPGTYSLRIEPTDNERNPIATAERTVVVPEMNGGRSDEPLDLGAIELK